MPFPSAVFTSDTAAWRQTEHAAAIFFVSFPGSVSEAPMSLSGSCWYREAASSHACLLSTKSTVSVHGLRIWTTWGTIWGKAENERWWSLTAASEKRGTTLEGQMTGLAGGHWSCNDTSVKFPFLLLKYIHPSLSHFSFSPQPQTPATGTLGGWSWLTAPIMHQGVSHYAKLSCGC